MKAQPVLFSLLLIIIAFLRGSQSFFNHSSTLSEKIVLGKLDEDVILPCSFESGPNIVIHWKNQDYNVHTYYKDNDHLEKQDPRYTNRTSLFHREIHNGNASLCFRRLSLPDEGSYMCYVATSSMKITSKVVLKVGDGLHKMRRENVLLSCELANYFFLPNQNFIVTWSRMKSGTFPVLAYSLSSSQNIVINEPRLLWSEELINQSDFSLTWTDLSAFDKPSQSTAPWIILLLVILVLLVSVMVFYGVKSRRCGDFIIGRSTVPTGGRAISADKEENIVLSEQLASTENKDNDAYDLLSQP